MNHCHQTTEGGLVVGEINLNLTSKVVFDGVRI